MPTAPLRKRVGKAARKKSGPLVRRGGGELAVRSWASHIETSPDVKVS
jgi:Fe-S cluster biogenesis protein NfuA